MADPILHSTFQHLVYLRVATPTRRTYKSGVTSFLNFCTMYDITPPSSTLTLQFYCTYLATQISYKTIKVYLAGIRQTHLELGYTDPTSSEPLRLLIRGVRRLQGESPHCRLPITIDTLHTLKQNLRCTNLSLCEQHLLRSVFTLAFYGFLRVSDLTGLQWADISFNTQDISVTIRQSKTNLFRKGHSFHITFTGTSACPVKALRQYVAIIPRETQHGPLFSAGQFSPLTRTQLSSILRRLLQNAGYNSDLYCTHSFRIGAATTAAAAGFPPWLIKTLGRWNSNAYISYIQVPTATLRQVPSILVRSNITGECPTWNPDEH